MYNAAHLGTDIPNNLAVQRQNFLLDFGQFRDLITKISGMQPIGKQHFAN